jgi:aspartate/methionine/tyrosine aminotransferase
MDKHIFSKRGHAVVGQEMFKVLDKAKILESQGKNIIHLELGQPRFAPPEGLIDITRKSLSEKEVGYSSSYGIFSFRKKLALSLSKQNPNIKVENIVIATTNLLISQCLHLLTNPSDRIVVFSPTFPTYIAASNFLELDLVQIPLSFDKKFQLSIEDIDRALLLRPKVIIVNSANNPTGAVYEGSLLNYLKEKCRENDIWIVSDETYSSIVYDKKFFSLLSAQYKNEIVISSFSKVYSIPGFRLGFAVASEAVIDKLALSNSSLISCNSIFTQKGVEGVLGNDNNYILEINKKLNGLIKEVEKLLLASENLKKSFVKPDGGYYMFLNISKSKLKSLDFCNMLLEKYSVACTPGISFGIDFDEFVRISICGSRQDVLNGLKRIISYFDNL